MEGPQAGEHVQWQALIGSLLGALRRWVRSQSNRAGLSSSKSSINEWQEKKQTQQQLRKQQKSYLVRCIMVNMSPDTKDDDKWLIKEAKGSPRYF
jgi:transposase-like protein